MTKLEPTPIKDFYIDEWRWSYDFDKKIVFLGQTPIPEENIRELVKEIDKINEKTNSNN